MIENITRIKCDHCGKVIEIPAETSPFLLILYVKHGWTLFKEKWFCKDCRPDDIKIREDQHPHYIDYQDVWDCRSVENCKSHYFLNEPYDPYASKLQGDLCKICYYCKRGYEDDGSSWLMCCVDDPDDSYGHNLYSGHFYGEPISGRICPYFTCNGWQGRNPAEDKKNGCFHVPYQERYDGD